MSGPTSSPGPPPALGATGFRQHLQQLESLHRERASTGSTDPAAPDELLADLETAYEELRVADEEVRTQQTHLEALRARHDLLHFHHQRMLSMLPVPALVTDAAGTVRFANAAAATTLLRPVSHLLGKPVFALFATEDRRALREALQGRPATDVPTHPVTHPATLASGSRDAVQVSLTAPATAAAEATWLLLPVGATREHERTLSAALVELAGLPALVHDQQEVLALAAALCARTLHAHDVTISLGSPAAPEALASTTEHAQDLDGAQVLAGEGPCITAHDTRGVVLSPDLLTDPRWPGLARSLQRTGRHAGPLPAIAAPIELGPRVVGAVNAYDLAATADSGETVSLLAATLGAVLHELELATELQELGDHLQRALTSRAEIDQAKGIIMATRGCTAEEAFEHLKAAASAQERKVRDVAHLIVEQASRR